MSKKIMVGVNTLINQDQAVYSNHCQLWYRWGRDFQDYEFALHNPRRMSIDRMRNETAKHAIAHNFDYVCFIDDDVLVPTAPVNGLKLLLDADKDIVGGWTIIRGYPFDNMFFKYDEAGTGLIKWNDIPQDEGLLEVGALGFSFVLIKCDLIRKIPPPWFITGPYNTEDVYFCVKAKKYVPEVEIFVDLSCKTSHNLGSEYIDPKNRAAYKEYFTKTFPEFVPSEGITARGDGYLKMVKDPTEESALAHINAGN